MPEQSIQKKLDKLDRIENREERKQRVSAEMGYRAIDIGTNLVGQGGLGALAAAKPEWDDLLYGFASPKVITLLAGIGLFVGAGTSGKRSKAIMRELGQGLVGAGGGQLASMGGAWLVNRFSE